MLRVKVEVFLRTTQSEQDVTDVANMLGESIQSLERFWVQDASHDHESEYEIAQVVWTEILP